MNPVFSIIIPTFNRAHMLSKAIESVVNQVFLDWELIVVDDGSTDATKDCVQRFNDNRIVYHWQENQERSAARNKGIALSKGRYICFLDSDDYYLPSHLQEFYNFIIEKEYPEAFIYSNLLFETKSGEVKPHIHDEEFNGDLAFILRTTIHSQQTCLHHSILKHYSFNPKFKVGEDIELWMKIFNEYPVYHIKAQTIVVVHHDNRTIDRYNTSAYKSIIGLYNHIFSKPNPGSKIPASYRRFLYSSVYFGIAKSHILNKKKWQAVFYLIKAVIKKPFVTYVKYRLYLIFKLLFAHNYCEVFIKEQGE